MESVDVAQLLPDELWLEVFSFVEPEHAGGAILACRRFHDIFATPTLWRRYHESLVGGPLQLVREPSLVEDEVASNTQDDDSVDDQEDEDEGKEIDAKTFPHFPPADGWRQALLWKLAQVQRQGSDEAKLVWAARLGCHRLVLRLLEGMRDRYDSLRSGGERSALTSTLPEDEDSEEYRLLRMCCRALAAACQANSVATARVRIRPDQDEHVDVDAGDGGDICRCCWHTERRRWSADTWASSARPSWRPSSTTTSS
jgi:hypothetical protein